MSDAILASGPRVLAVPTGWSTTELFPERHLLVRTELPIQPRIYRSTGKTVVVLGEPNIADTTDRFLHSSAFPGVTAGELREWSEGYTGHFAVLAIHHESGAVVYATDLMETIPVYHAETADGTVVGTHLDAVSHTSGHEALDRVSMMDFLISGTIAPPATWFKDVEIAPAASVAIAKPGTRWNEQFYWTPEEASRLPFKSINETAEALTALMDENVRLALNGHDRAGALVSGGEDSRVVVGLAKRHREQIECVTFLERMNREGRLARTAMKALGCTLRLCKRENDYYLRYLAERRELVGSGLDVRHTHAFKLLPIGQWDVVLGGLFADTLLKADKARYEPVRRIRNIRVSKNRLSGDQGFGWPKSIQHEMLDPSLFREVERRRHHHFRSVQRHRPHSAFGWRTVWPAGAAHGSLTHFSSCRRLVNMQEPFAYNNAVAFAASLPEETKVDGYLYRLAFKNAMGRSGWVPRISGRIPRLGFYPNIAATLAFAAWAKTVDHLKGHDGAWEGPWPSFNHLMTVLLDQSSLPASQSSLSETVQNLFLGQPSIQALFSDPRIDQFAKHRLLQILTAPDPTHIETTANLA